MTTTHLSLYVTRDVEAMAETAVDIIAAQAEKAYARSGQFNIAVSGGKTPLPLFRLLASPAKAGLVDWNRTVVYWVDERCVSPEDPESNYRVARQELFSRVDATRFYRMKGEDRPQDAAAAYEKLLGEHFSLLPGEPPRFDCVLLGVGKDGHTGSLFPGDQALKIEDALVADVYPSATSTPRLTLTLPVLNNARCCIFLASGREKHHVLSTALNLMAAPMLPAQMVRPHNGRLCWVIDEQAYQG